MRTHNMVGLFLVSSGSIILVWVGWLTWYDMVLWGKDITLIFFESRAGEAISLGIDMRVIHYLTMSFVFLFSSLLAFRLEQFKHLTGPTRNIPIRRGLIEKLKHEQAKLVASLALIIIMGAFLSFLRDNTVAVVGVFTLFSALVIAVLTGVIEIEVVSSTEENVGMDETLVKENRSYKTISNTSILDIDQTSIHLKKTNEFRVDIHSSKNQATLSSHYAPRRAHIVKRPVRTAFRREDQRR